MWLWFTAGEVRHALEISSERTACGIGIDRLRTGDYDRTIDLCEVCQKIVEDKREGLKRDENF